MQHDKYRDENGITRIPPTCLPPFLTIFLHILSCTVVAQRSVVTGLALAPSGHGLLQLHLYANPQLPGAVVRHLRRRDVLHGDADPLEQCDLIPSPPPCPPPHD